MKRSAKIALSVMSAAILIWTAAFVVDYSCALNLRKPVFVVAGETADDGGSGAYYGLGYTVNLDVYLDADYGLTVQSVEMRMFGRVIAASIS